MKAIVLTLLFLSFIAGCDSSKPAPKPLSAYPALLPEDAKKVLQQQEAQQACSEQNLKKATAEQRQNCNPTHGMFDNVRPQQPPPKTSQNTKTSRIAQTRN